MFRFSKSLYSTLEQDIHTNSQMLGGLPRPRFYQENADVRVFRQAVGKNTSASATFLR